MDWMNDLENGMLIGAAEAWEQLCSETPWMVRTDRKVLAFAYDEGLAGDIIMDWLQAKECDESAAWELFERLPKQEQVRLAECYIDRREDLIGKYNGEDKEDW